MPLSRRLSAEPELTAKGAATRRRIVQAAAELVRERGFNSTSTDDILRATGVSNSQLYHYFADKDDLALAVIAFQIDRLMTLHEPLLANLASLEGLERWRDAVLLTASRRRGLGGCPVGSLASELSDLDERARKALAAGFERWELAIAAGLSGLQARGVLRGDADPWALATATLAALQGGLLLAQARRDVTPLATALDAMLAHIRTFSV